MNIGLLYAVNLDYKPMYYLKPGDYNIDYYTIRNEPHWEAEGFKRFSSFNKTKDNCSIKYNWYKEYLLDLKSAVKI